MHLPDRPYLGENRHRREQLPGALRIGLALLCAIAFSSCGAVRSPQNKHADVPTTPLTRGGTWPTELPETSMVAIAAENGELIWTIESTDRKDWHSSRWLFADVDQELERKSGVYTHCDTALASFKLLRKKVYDNCDRKMGEWYRGIGDWRLEQFTLRSENIQFTGHCSDWNSSRFFHPINYRCQAKGVVFGAGINSGKTYHVVLRFPLDLLADIPLGPVE